MAGSCPTPFLRRYFFVLANGGLSQKKKNSELNKIQQLYALANILIIQTKPNSMELVRFRWVRFRLTQLCWFSLVDPVIFLLSLSNERFLQIFRELSDVLAERFIGSEGCAPKRRGGLLSSQNLGPSWPWDTKFGRWLYSWKGEDFGPVLRTCSVLKRSARPRGRAR
ncbi:protein YhjJ [Striga asiatica]|uniref:Protein YhjJ n=1 Tax=Striga asiatica TaxID=4170 RepID=A0A5A7QX45_STRAF|nr:protein YhjJ [Striga asiatica]